MNTEQLMIQGIKFNLNDHLYLKDPQNTEFGQRLLKATIELMSEIGFEAFTFKKLAEQMGTAEASIYRYFMNKHLLLLYLYCWYWEWVSFLISINLRNIEDPKMKMKIVIHTIVNASFESPLTDYINENMLHRIIINEGSKAYHINDVDKENKKGLFLSYKSLVEKVSNVILEVSPKFPYSKSLASNLFEMANNQIYFAEHLPRLTDLKQSEDVYDALEEMMIYFTFKVLGRSI
jgi:AcrR family transcriptional regulator